MRYPEDNFSIVLPICVLLKLRLRLALIAPTLVLINIPIVIILHDLVVIGHILVA
ncbi:hypothetical protein D3C73_1498420 [compost metagenome]